MERSVREKLDLALATALSAFEDSGRVDGDAAISVNLYFEGDIAPIAALGFEVHSVAEDQALGVVRFRDIATVVAHPNVLRMSGGTEPSLDMDDAAPDGKARATSTGSVGGAGGDGLWFATPAGDLSPAEATGSGVIVAILDTGIDFTHPSFMREMTPDRKSRILRIWDQGLRPTSLAECPDVSLLVSANTYGVEYKNDAAPNDFIDQALAGSATILHRDCEGHGTHVAGIAAGGVKFPTNGNVRIVGVAPEANIIAVKLLDVPDTINFRLAAGFGAQVTFATRFRDAIIYCLRTAKELGKPIVINLSFGNTSEPGDGLDDDARWVDARLDPTQAAGDMNFPTGAIVVKSSGNNGNDLSERVAKIKFLAAGSISVPLSLKDDRVGVNEKRINCAPVLHKPNVRAVFWYRRNFDVVKFALKLLHETSFSPDMGIGGWEEHSFVVRSGPPRTVLTSASPAAHHIKAEHTTDPAVSHPAGGTVRRHSFAVTVTPKVNGTVVTYPDGIYEVRITAPADTELFLSCSIAGFSPGHFVQFRLAPTLANGDPRSSDIVPSADFSAVDTLGKHVITVASYDDGTHHIADSSSRGPLRDFSDPPGTPGLLADKPDIAAPGEDIEAAESADSAERPVVPTADWLAGIRFVPKSGTSMSTPFIVGVIALLLDKTSTLNVDQVRTALTGAGAPRDGAHPAPPGDAHKHAFGAGMVHALKSHRNAP